MVLSNQYNVRKKEDGNLMTLSLLNLKKNRTGTRGTFWTSPS
jgi:hypothetical protein